MKPTNLIILFLIGVFTLSCSSRYDRFTYRFDGKPTGIDSLINVDGFYAEVNHRCFSSWTFYRDGTFGGHIRLNYYTRNCQCDSIIEIRSWGKYIISHDTIKVQSILNFHPYSLINMAGIHTYEEWYRVINKDTMIRICKKRLSDEPRLDRFHYVHDTAFFVPTKYRPDSTCWLKEKGWAWEKK